MLTTSIFGRKKNILTKKNISTDDRKNDIIARHQLVTGYVSHVFAELAHTTLLCGPAAQKLNLKKTSSRPLGGAPVTRSYLSYTEPHFTDGSALKYLSKSGPNVTFFPSVFWLLIFCLANGGLD